MDTLFEASVKDSYARHIAAINEGQKIIRGRWKTLAQETKTALVDSGFYSIRGEHRDPEGIESKLPQHDAERLEQSLGVFKLCLAAKLPTGTEKGHPIPPEASTDDVMSAAGELLFVRQWQDPYFLRLALSAVARHQQANALCLRTPESRLGPAWGCLGAMLKAALFLAMPVALASGLAASARQDVVGASLAFYVLAFGVLAALSAAGIGVKKKDGFELAYDRWTRFQLNGAAGVTGAGALEHLRQMAEDGIDIPLIAFDVAETLRARSAL